MALGLALLTACGGAPESMAIRLVDRFQEDMVQNRPTTRAPSDPEAAWKFGEPSGTQPKEAPATLGWKAAIGVSGLSLRGGRLAGRTTTDFPIIYVERTDGLDTPDVLHSIEVRLRAGKGANLMAKVEGEDDLNVKRVLDQAKGLSQPWAFSTPIVAGENSQTVTLRSSSTVRMSSIHKLLIRPTDEAGAEFEIESIRLISRKEHLALIPSGVGWQGLAEIYRETVVSRAPESIVFDLELSGNPWLDLHIGTVEDAPVTFQVRLTDSGSDPMEGMLLLERTITTPDRWDPAPIDFSPYSGREVALSLSLSAQDAGTLGFWGAAAIRNRSGVSPRAQARPSIDLVPGPKPPQGVILVVADTLRKDHLDPYGYERKTAPTLARMAAEGALFEDNVAQATWTKVSVPTILTSLYPASHRVKDMADRLPAAAVTLAEVFRDAGYATVSYSSVPFSGKFTNLHQGFEELHERGSVDSEGYGSKTARTYVDRVGEWLETHRDEPFFVFLHVFDPHSPFEPRRPYNTVWSDPAKRDQHDKNVEQVKKFIDHESDRRRVMPTLEELRKSGVDREELMSYFVGWYDGSIRAMDTEVGRLLERLRELGLADKTLLAFTSDHGEGFHEHGQMWHGQTVYGELTGVPLLFYGPAYLPGGLVIDETVQNIDIMPTLLELSHLPLPEQTQGRSLLSLMAAARDVANSQGSTLAEAANGYGWTPQPAFSEKAATQQSGGPRPYETEAYSIVDAGWKLIHHTKRIEEGPEFELYDHKKDPLNLDNVAEQHPDLVQQLRVKLEAHREQTMASSLPEGDSTEGLSDEELQRLRSLGYIQ